MHPATAVPLPAPKVRPRAADDLVFQPSPTTSLGVELELQILDHESGDLAPGAVRILKACAEEGIDGVTAELMQSMIEIKTGVCADVDGVREEMVSTLRLVRNIASSLGYDLALGGTHPFHRTCGSVVYPGERYEKIQDRLAWLTYQRVVFGLHVHVGVPSGDLAIGLINMLVQYLPHLVALSSNSPFWQGVDTGLATSRVALYRLLPHAGVPRYFRKWKEFRRYCQVLRDCHTIHSFKDIYWDIRPRPDFGTIEFRICDTPPSLALTFGMVALIQSLVNFGLKLLEERPQLRHGDARRQWIAIENKWLATRYGLGATYIRTPGGKRRGLAHDLTELLVHRLNPIARETGAYPFLAPFQDLDNFETGADRQRRLYREKGNWKALIDDQKHRLAEELA